MNEAREVTISLGTATGLALVVGGISIAVAFAVALIIRLTRRG